MAALVLWRLRAGQSFSVKPSGLPAANTSASAPGTSASPAATAVASTSAATRPESSDAIRFLFDGPLQENGLPKSWEARVIVGKLQSEVVNEPSGEKCLRMKCDESHFVIWCKTTPIDPEKFPIIAWRWEARTLPPRGDSRTHAALPMVGDYRNDKGLQLMVSFEGDLVLNYVWDSNAPVGYELDERSPVATIKTQVVDTGPPTPGKREHRIDVRADFIHRFGKPPGKILGVGVSANTNHTKAQSDGTVGAIRLLPADLP
jgi:Protein of unknown function (DUF3047)